MRSVSAFTLGDVARICKIPPARLRYWERTALLEAAPRADVSNRYGFRDLVTVRSLVGLLDRGVPLRRIRSSVESVRRRMPDVERPLGSLRVSDGFQRVVVRHDGVLLEPDGQVLFDFAPSDAVVCGVASLPRDVEIAEVDSTRDRAVVWFERGCKLDSERSTLGDAIDAYLSAIEADPDFADAHCNLGSLYFNQDRRGRARASFQRALAIDPHHVEANLNLATLLEEDGRNERALGHYKSALASDPLYADTHVSLALLYEKLGLRRKSLDHWRRYLQLEPSGGWADLARRRLRD